MPFVQISAPWFPDPPHCAVAWHNSGLIVWIVIAALVACLWGIVRECDRPMRRVLRRSLRIVPPVRPRSPLPPRIHASASADSRDALRLLVKRHLQS